MAEIVERVARAICGAAGARDPDDTEGGPHPVSRWLDKGEPWFLGYMDAARAAIAAMREPTEAMLAAAAEDDELSWSREPGGPAVRDWIPASGSTWRVMIDAALTDDVKA